MDVSEIIGLYNVKTILTDNSVQKLRNQKLNKTKCDFLDQIRLVRSSLDLGDVTFMKEWVKALDDTRILAPADLKNLVSFPRYGHLKIPKGPNQISLYRF